MMNLLEKLERQAERLLGIIDGQLNQPIVNTITGEVFTHDTPPVEPGIQQQSVQEPSVPAPRPTRESGMTDRVLKQARG